jgi:hypothetical protein
VENDFSLVVDPEHCCGNFSLFMVDAGVFKAGESTASGTEAIAVKEGLSSELVLTLPPT